MKILRIINTFTQNVRKVATAARQIPEDYETVFTSIKSFRGKYLEKHGMFTATNEHVPQELASMLSKWCHKSGTDIEDIKSILAHTREIDSKICFVEFFHSGGQFASHVIPPIHTKHESRLAGDDYDFYVGGG